jgi:hypothetical protein
LETIGSGTHVCVSGLVTHLQHPQTAKGVVFASLEDETGINNIGSATILSHFLRVGGRRSDFQATASCFAGLSSVSITR